MMCMLASYNKKNFASLKSMKKEVGSGVGSGSGLDPEPDPDPFVRGTDPGI